MRKLKLVLSGLLMAFASMTANASTLVVPSTITLDGSGATIGYIGVAPQNTAAPDVNGLFHYNYNVDVVNNLSLTSWVMTYTDDLALGVTNPRLEARLFDSNNVLVESVFAGLNESPVAFNWLGLAVDTYKLVVSSTSRSFQGDVTSQISAVPVPAAALLFGTALLGFAGFSTRRKV